MRILLDTHSFLWFIAGDERLSAMARALMENPDNELALSVASVWEMAIKHSLGKLPVARPFADIIPAQITANGIQVLPISVAHAAHVALLPFHHRDPFDRLLIAQSMLERLPLLSADPAFDAYNIQRLW